MQSELQAELIHCPNCDEDVPKTLYCLNCGYPLYKLEQEAETKPEASGIEETTEPVETEAVSEPEIEAEVTTLAEEDVAPEEPVIEETEVEKVTEIVTVEEEMEPVEITKMVTIEEEVEPVEALEEAEEVVPEAVPVPEQAVEGPVPEQAVETVETVEEPIATEEEPAETIEETLVETAEESVETVETEVVEEPQELPVAEEVQEETFEFEPDPLVTEVMRSLARNISFKVRLINLLCGGEVKESTFNRLFESYAAQGERWMNRRNEMLERRRYDMDSMERAIVDARTGLEELEIRVAIGDASEEEYQAKAPAFNWDIDQYEGELQRRKGEIAYLEDFSRAIPEEEIEALLEMAEGCHGAMESLVESEKLSSETAKRIKVALEEALACLKGPGCE